MNLAEFATVQKLLESNGFSFKKSLGQNFLIDPNVCPAMADAACDENTGVIEIGPGIGVLTCELAKTAKKVVALEVDMRLKPILAKTLAEFNNVTVIFEDALKADLIKIINEHFSDCSRVCVCANLPYYITSPIITELLSRRLPLDSITVMVQQEAAERLCAEVGSRQAGAVTVAVQYFAKADILFNVDRDSFMPAPKVDSAVINLKILEKPAVDVDDEPAFFRFVKACFAQRRKTLLNTVSSTLHIEKPVLTEVLARLGLPATVRGETLTMQQLADITNALLKTTKF